ncbi:hypothetical protein HDU88_006472 [Geranomyces variabilis]|nr:hypothetical protein HDU88_006472 [Geranomyces variabilis]
MAHEALLPDLFASKDAAYLKRCFEDMALYLDQYAGRPVRPERSFDCHAVITLAKVPAASSCPLQISEKSTSEPMMRSVFGKKVDFMYHVQKDEYAENSGAPAARKKKTLRTSSTSCTNTKMSRFPRDDGDVLGMLELVNAFLVMRDIIESTALATTKTRTKRTARRLTTPPRPQLLAGVTTPPTKAAGEKKTSTAKKAKAKENASSASEGPGVVRACLPPAQG